MLFNAPSIFLRSCATSLKDKMFRCASSDSNNSSCCRGESNKSFAMPLPFRQSQNSTKSATTMLSSSSSSGKISTPDPNLAVNADSIQKNLMGEPMILVDENDCVVGMAPKGYTHRWSSITNPNAHTLHRAFSVFIFNLEGKLLLQQRSPHKITFPSVWTNTVCSHPLFAQEELEYSDDGVRDCAASLADIWPDYVPETGLTNNDAWALGVRNAARRKLQHELGLASFELPSAKELKALTRIMYCASTPEGEWGEQELDYILFLRSAFPFEGRFNANEIHTTRFVSQEELQILMQDPNYKWSPWFVKIANKFLMKWWSDLDSIFDSNAHVDRDVIHRL